MKKLTVQKEEGIAEVIDRLLAEPDDEVTLVIPTGSPLARSISNFHLLKREADAAGKTVSIESVDDTVLAFARESDLEGNHPLWRGVRGTTNGVSDIIPAGRDAEEENESAGDDEEAAGDEEEKEARSAPTARAQKAKNLAAKEAPAKPAKIKKKKETPVKLTVQAEDDEVDVDAEGDMEAAQTLKVTVGPRTQEEAEEFKEKESKFFGGDRFFSKRSATVKDEDGDDDEDGFSESGSGRGWLWVGGVVLAVLVVLGLMTWVFDRATVTINFEQTPWSYQGNFVADDSISTPNPTTDAIPAQLFTSEKNVTQLFPASGSANVSLKAQGTITIYNDYSSAPQELVATTRFLTPDGKIFRIVSDITVPGATVSNGQIVASSITAPVVADQAGTAYNESPVAKLSIPGFQGSPKYNGFYGALLDGTSGGFIGTRPVPTAADITAAEAKVTATLQSDLTSNLTTSYPNNFKILPGATNVSVTKLTVTTTTDANGNFSVYGDATLNAIGFDESAFKTFLLELDQVSNPSSTFASSTLTYTNVQANFTKGTVSFALSGTGILEPAFDSDSFKADIAGKSISGARAVVAGLQGLQQGTISVWPIWLWSIPNNPNKIIVNAN